MHDKRDSFYQTMINIGGSTWLLDHSIKVKCIKVTPYMFNDDVLLDTEQIIPVSDAEDYVIKLANKKQQEMITQDKSKARHVVRLKFWGQLLSTMNEKSELFSNVSASKDNWLSCGSGFGGVLYSLVATGTHARVELWINRGVKEVNKELFDRIENYKSEIENDLGFALSWERKDDIKTCRIAYYLNDVNVFNEEDWGKMIEFLVPNMIKFESVISKVLWKVIN